MTRPRTRGAVVTQCAYSFGPPTLCRMVQLRHRPGSGEWQAPVWVCAACRRYLQGRFRYYHLPVAEHTTEEVDDALRFFGLLAGT